MKALTLKQLLTLASDYYEDSYLQEYIDENGNPKDGSGDSLAKFIVNEIAETFDPENSKQQQLSIAIDRLKASITQTQAVIDGLENCYLFSVLTKC